MKKVILVLALTLVMSLGSFSVFAAVNNGSSNELSGTITSNTQDGTIILFSIPWPDPDID